MWMYVGGKDVNNHFHGKWLSKGSTQHPDAPQYHKLGVWLFPLSILETIKKNSLK
jgi:hypothetical protein